MEWQTYIVLVTQQNVNKNISMLDNNMKLNVIVSNKSKKKKVEIFGENRCFNSPLNSSNWEFSFQMGVPEKENPNPVFGSSSQHLGD